MKIFKKLFFFSFLFFSYAIYGQEPLSDVAAKELELLHLFNDLTASQEVGKKLEINQKIIETLRQTLAIDESFAYSFDTLKNIGIISSPDDALKLYTWNVPLNAGMHNYYCFMQLKNKKDISVIELNHSPFLHEGFEYASLTDKNWYGALYYQIIPKKIDGKKYYTLIGIDFYDLLSTRKIFDVVYFSEEMDRAFFGAPIFDMGQVQKRVIYQYSSRVVMSARYYEKSDRIVFDHLSPSKPSLEGKYQFYGPDFSYDAFEYEKGMWMFLKDIEMRNE